MSLLEKLQAVISLAAVGIGLGLSQIPAVAQRADLFILPFLISMLVGAFLGVSLEGVTDAFRSCSQERSLPWSRCFWAEASSSRSSYRSAWPSAFGAPPSCGGVNSGSKTDSYLGCSRPRSCFWAW